MLNNPDTSQVGLVRIYDSYGRVQDQNKLELSSLKVSKIRNRVTSGINPAAAAHQLVTSCTPEAV